jgi:Zn-dependent metalloprotease
MRRILPRSTSTLVLSLGLALGACAETGAPDDDAPGPDGIHDAIAQLPRVDAVEQGARGRPFFVAGELGRVDVPADLAGTHAQLAPALARLAPVFRMRASDLVPMSMHVDETGTSHIRYRQARHGLPVIGGELIVHLDADGVVSAATASPLGERDPGPVAEVAAEAARLHARLATPVVGAQAAPPRLVYVVSARDGELHLAWETLVTATPPDGIPEDDLVYVDAHSGAVADVHPQVFTARVRKVYSANNTTDLPGTLLRSEGGPPSSDVDVNAAYDNTGTTYDAYSYFFGRDSFDNAGATLISSVHYGTNVVNAYWNGTQMNYGDGDGVTAGPFARGLDVTGHELTHAVTASTWAGRYEQESGALNESWSDIFGEVAEYYADGQVVSADTWKVGEDVWTPNVAGDALRYMNDPAADGRSIDWYPNRTVVATPDSSNDWGGVHTNSGISNLAFELAVMGGRHPRGRSTIPVPAIGMDKAARIFYLAATSYMTSTTDFAAARVATARAASALFGPDERYAIEAAWYAVGVGPAPDAPSLLSLGRPRAFADANGATHVVYRGAHNHIHEIALTPSGWVHTDLSGVPGFVAADGDPMGYEGGGAARVVYRGVDGHVHELALTASGWQHGDLSAASGALKALGNPYGYLDAGGIPRVIYRGMDGHLHEIYLFGIWLHDDLAGAGAVDMVGDAMGYVGAGVTRVVYRSLDSHIHELFLSGRWTDWDMNSLAGAVRAKGTPVGVASPGALRVFYRSIDNHVHVMEGTDQWRHVDLHSAATQADPWGYVDPAGALRVAYRGEDSHVYEYTFTDHWEHADLNLLLPGAPLAQSAPFGLFSSGVARQYYQAADSTIREVFLWNGSWVQWDMSTVFP